VVVASGTRLVFLDVKAGTTLWVHTLPFGQESRKGVTVFSDHTTASKGCLAIQGPKFADLDDDGWLDVLLLCKGPALGNAYALEFLEAISFRTRRTLWRSPVTVNYEDPLRLDPADLLRERDWPIVTDLDADGRVEVVLPSKVHQPGDLGDPYSGFDLRLISPLNDVRGVPAEGKNLVIVAAVKDVLHFRILDGDGQVIVNTDETTTRLTEQAGQIKDLTERLKSLWPPHELTRSDKDRVITAVTSIVVHTPYLGSARGVEVRDGADGRVRWRRPVQVSPYASPIDHLTVGPDSDGDGRRDVFVASSRLGKPDPPTVDVDCLSGKDGRSLWRWSHPLPVDPGGWIGSVSSFGPLVWWSAGPGGKPALLLPIFQPRIAGLEGGPPDAIYVISPQTGRPLQVVSGAAKPLMADFDGDGFEDLGYRLMRGSQPPSVPGVGVAYGQLRALRGTSPGQAAPKRDGGKPRR
jgi:hypothetical protein